jgi:shikimate kinase
VRGVGRASAAISVVNAIPSGVGCAHGVRLYAVVSAALEASSAERVEVEPSASATPLVLGSVRAALSHLHPEAPMSAHLQIDSEIPVGKGLKSSSAVATATIRAVADALGTSVDPLETARWAARVAVEVGVSATGAFDDALAGLLTGFIITDNRSGQLLSRRSADPDWTAVLHVPGGVHPSSPGLQSAFRRAEAEGKAAATAALRGAWTEAMERNTLLVERVMGYEYGDLRGRARALGAVASGVSGLGPALVSLVPSARASAVLNAMPPGGFVVPLTSEAHP